jgi:hypothetical protein
VGVLGPNFLHKLQGQQFCGAVARGTEPAGLHLLLPMEQWKLWDLLTELSFSLAFQDKGSWSCIVEEFLCVLGSGIYH